MDDVRTGWLGRVPRGRTVAISFIVFVGFMLVVFPAWMAVNHIPDDVTVMDLRLSYTPQELYGAFDALGQSGRLAYVRNILILDVAWPLVFGTFLTLLPLYAFADQPSSRRRVLGSIAVIAVLFDYSENMSVLALLLQYPERLDWLVRVASTFTTLKWVFVSAAMLLALVSALRLARRSLTTRASRNRPA